MFEEIKHDAWKKLYCNTLYAQAICVMSSCLIWQQLILVFMLAMSIAGIFMSCQFLNSTCMGLTVDCECRYHCTDKKQEFHHQQDDYACMLLFITGAIVAFSFLHLLMICNVIAILGVKPFIKCHVIELMWLHHNQYHCVCLTSFSQKTDVNYCTVNIVSYSAAYVSKKKYVWLAVNNLHPNYWANVSSFYF
jgi:hypothetical protein